MNQPILLTSTLCGIASATTLLASPAEAQIIIEDNIAQQEATPIKIVPGRTSTIHLKNESSISYIKLSDPSKTVYSVNAPVNSGYAKTIFLNQTEKNKFPGQTTHDRPNLYVVAIDEEGNQKNYEFIIDNSPQNDTKISIVSPPTEENKPVNAINTELGLASPYNVLEGLKYKLRKEEISSDSPLIMYVSELISTTLNSDKTLLEAAEEFQVPLSVLAELGRVGLIEETKARKLHAERIQAFGDRETEMVMSPPPKPIPTTRDLVPPPVNISSSLPQNQTVAATNLNIIETDLGSATLEDVKFGLSILRQKNQISEQKARSLELAIKGNLQVNNTATMTEIREIARIGLAFETRLRVRGSIS